MSVSFLCSSPVPFTSLSQRFHVLDVLVQHDRPRGGTFIVIVQIFDFQTEIEKARPLIQSDALVVVLAFQKLREGLDAVFGDPFAVAEQHANQRHHHLLVQRPVRPGQIEAETKFVKILELCVFQKAQFAGGQLLLEGLPGIGLQSFAPVGPFGRGNATGFFFAAVHLPQQHQEANVFGRVNPQFVAQFANA